MMVVMGGDANGEPSERRYSGGSGGGSVGSDECGVDGGRDECSE